MDPLKVIEKITGESIRAKKDFLADGDVTGAVAKAASALVASLKNGGKILVFGNGGSSSDSQHMAAELVVKFEKKRKPFACIDLTSNAANVTSAGNDFDFSDIFSRQVRALGSKNDAVIAISTSGRSRNVLEAVSAARELGLTVIALTGGDGGDLRGMSDIPIVVRDKNAARIQEVHIMIIHILCKLIEEALS